LHVVLFFLLFLLGRETIKTLLPMTDTAAVRPAALDFTALVGMTGTEAKTQIEAMVPGVAVSVLPVGACVTKEFRDDRIRVFLSAAGRVANTPRRG
jgi:hypothetical protein